MKLDDISFDETLGRPFSRFIKLAATDSGYTPSQVNTSLVKWVHPLFLKAKADASKQDNPSCKQ